LAKSAAKRTSYPGIAQVSTKPGKAQRMMPGAAYETTMSRVSREAAGNRADTYAGTLVGISLAADDVLDSSREVDENNN